MRLPIIIVAFIGLTSVSASVMAADITGRITYAGAPPPEIKIDSGPGAICEPNVTTRHYVISPSGGLANVMVWISSGLPAGSFPPATDVAQMEFDGCRFHPYLAAIRTGQRIAITNRSPILVNVHPVPKINRELNQGLLPNKNTEFSFSLPEFPLRIKDDVHPWNFAYVGVFDHPYFAVTDPEGTFRIRNVPAGGNYVVTIAHLKAGTFHQPVTLGANGASVSHTFTPLTIQMTLPNQPAELRPPARIKLAATVSGASVATVEFYQSFRPVDQPASAWRPFESIGEITTPPYEGIWSGVPAGEYRFQAQVTDDRGRMATGSVSFPITVREATIINARPTLHINNPAVSPVHVAANALMLEGTASDDRLVTGVWIQQDGGSFRLASGTDRWTAAVVLHPGENVFRIKAVDDLGAESDLGFRTIIYDLPNPFPVLRGSYVGLCYHAQGPESDNAGFLTLELSKSGAYSAKLKRARDVVSFSDRFGSDLRSMKLVADKVTGGTLEINLQIDANTGELAGSIRWGRTTADVVGYRAPFGKKSPAAGFVGTSSIVTTRPEPFRGSRMGYGVASVKVVSSGAATLVAFLPNGVKYTQRGPLASNGQLPVFAATKRGTLLGWITLAQTQGGAFEGQLRWSWSPPIGSVRVEELEVTGCWYAPPAKGQLAVNLPIGTLIAGADDTLLIAGGRLDTSHKITVATAREVKGTIRIQAKSGLVTGTINGRSSAKIKVQGIVLQEQRVIAGYCTAPGIEGEFLYGADASVSVF